MRYSSHVKQQQILMWLHLIFILWLFHPTMTVLHHFLLFHGYILPWSTSTSSIHTSHPLFSSLSSQCPLLLLLPHQVFFLPKVHPCWISTGILCHTKLTFQVMPTVHSPISSTSLPHIVFHQHHLSFHDYFNQTPRLFHYTTFIIYHLLGMFHASMYKGHYHHPPINHCILLKAWCNPSIWWSHQWPPSIFDTQPSPFFPSC